MDEFLTAIEARRQSYSRPQIEEQNFGGEEDTWHKVLEIVNKNPNAWERSCAMLFSALDRTGCGKVDIVQLQKGLSSFGIQLSQQETLAFHRALDANGNSTISKQEFQDAIAHQQTVRSRSAPKFARQASIDRPPETPSSWGTNTAIGNSAPGRSDASRNNQWR